MICIDETGNAVLKNTKKIPRLIQHPDDAAVACFADKYFLRTKDIVNRFSDTTVTYAAVSYTHLTLPTSDLV